MPYIEDKDDGHPQGTLRERRRPQWLVAENEGELNFAISCLIGDYMMYHGISYDRMGDCTSACLNAMVEFQRTVMAPYEDMKRIQNGEVYGTLVDAVQMAHQRAVLQSLRDQGFEVDEAR